MDILQVLFDILKCLRGVVNSKKYKIHSIVLDSSAIFPEIYEKKDLIFARLPLR